MASSPACAKGQGTNLDPPLLYSKCVGREQDAAGSDPCSVYRFSIFGMYLLYFLALLSVTGE